MTQQPSSRSRRMCPDSHSTCRSGRAAVGSSRMSTRGSVGQHPDQFDDLAVRHRQVGRGGPAVDVVHADSGAGSRPPPATSRPRRTRPSRPRGGSCSSRFSATRQVGQQRQFLERGGHAEPPPGGRLDHPPHRVAEDLDRAPVGADQSTEDFDERALARAVLAGEGVDLSGTRRERRVPESLDPAEGTVDAGRPYREDLRVGRGPDASVVGAIDGVPMVRTLPRLTLSVLPGQGVPSVAASWHRTTVALGPESVKSAKKLSGRSGKTVSPTTRESEVATGNGIVMLCLGVLALEHRPGQFQRDHRQERRLPDRHAGHLGWRDAGHVLAEAVLALAGEDRHRPAGVGERLDHAVGAAGDPDAVDLGQARQLRRGDPLRGGRVPHAAVRRRRP